MPAADGDDHRARLQRQHPLAHRRRRCRRPAGRVTYEGDARIDGVAGTAAPIRLNFLDAWGAVTGSVFPTGQRIDVIDGVEVTCIDAAMPLMIVRAGDLGVDRARDARRARRRHRRCSSGWRRCAAPPARRWGSATSPTASSPSPCSSARATTPHSITSRYFTPRRCHASHAVDRRHRRRHRLRPARHRGRDGSGDGSTGTRRARTHDIAVLHPQGRIDVEVEVGSADGQVVVTQRVAGAHRPQDPAGRAAPARLRVLRRRPGSRPDDRGRHGRAAQAVPPRPITIIVPTAAGGANDAIARAIARSSARCSARPSSSTTAPAPTVRSRASTWPEPRPTATPCCSATSPPTR